MTGLVGLVEAEAVARRRRGQGNTVPPPTGRTYLQIVRENVVTFVNCVIVGLAAGLALLGQWSDALVSVGVISVNVLVGVLQEARAKHVLDRIALLTRPRGRAIRSGVERTIDPEEVVVGDLLRVGPGDQILVDGTVVAGEGLEVDESLLTGEDEAVSKGPGDKVYSGSYCVSGGAVYEAQEVGDACVANQLTRSARAFRRVVTPLQRQVNVIVRVILLVALSFGLVLVASAVVDGLPAVQIVQLAIVVAGLVPNGLFLAIAAAYAMGAVRLVGGGVLVQQANAVESLSHTDVLCLDKTGTITSGRLLLEEVRPLGGDADAARALLGDLIASGSTGNRTSDAIAAACPGLRRAVRDEVAFSSERKWSGVAFDEARAGLCVLGAPEVIAPALAFDAAAVAEAVRERAATGLRVMLLARGEGASLRDGAGRPELPDRLAPMALVSLRDELRPDLGATLAGFAEAGIALKVISGDHPQTVRAIALQAGLPVGDRVVVGDQLAACDAAGLESLAAEETVFARVTPAQKEGLVRALRRRGRYVAMVGDGVNDVAALKAADLAIALHGGAQAARAVADLMLIDDSFAGLPVAFREGQRVLRGMQCILRLFLTRVGYVALVIAAIALADAGFPYTPKQNALLTLLTVGIPAIVLAALARPAPVQRDGLMRSLVHFVIPAAWSIAAAGLVLYLGFVVVGGSQDLARAALTTFSVLAGVLLVRFADFAPERSGADRIAGGGWPATVLVLGLLVAFGRVLTDDGLRVFFDLGGLAPWQVLLASGYAAGWLCVLLWGWRERVMERALGIEPPSRA